MNRVAVLAAAVTMMITLPTIAPAQDANRLNLFLDCAMHCDRQFLRTEMVSVNWVTDRTAADVHVIATRLGTGAGGSEVTLAFLGRDGLAALADTVHYTTSPDATSDDSRRELLRYLRLGMVHFQLAAGKAQSLEVSTDLSPSAVESQPTNDPWNHWVFNLGADGELNAETRQVGYELGGDVRADRITEALKVRLHLEGDLDRTTFTLDSGQKFIARRDRWGSSALVVGSVGPHWSIGVTGSTRGSKPDNLDLRIRLGPAVEWDLFPYAEATRRQLLLIYSIGATHYDYVEPTIFDKLSETRFNHELQISFDSRQPWGNASISGSASSFLDDWSRNRLGLQARGDVRLARGLSFEVRGSISRVRDQITLRKGDASDEEVFLRLRELATDYRAQLKVGMNYTFGSFFNTVVNPRFDELD